MDTSFVLKEIKLSVCLTCGSPIRGGLCGYTCKYDGFAPLDRPRDTIGSATYTLKDVVEFCIDDRNNVGQQGIPGPSGSK